MQAQVKSAYLWAHEARRARRAEVNAARAGILVYLRTRRRLDEQYTPAGAVLTVKRLVRSGDSIGWQGNPRAYSRAERARRFPRGSQAAVKTGGARHGLAAHRDVQRFTRALNAGASAVPRLRTLAGKLAVIKLASIGLLPVAAELVVGGRNAQGARFGTRVDVFCLDTAAARHHRYVAVELKTGRDNEVVDAPGEHALPQRDLFPGARKSPLHFNLLQIAATAAFMRLRFEGAGPLAEYLDEDARFEFYLLRIVESRGDAVVGRMPQSWLDSMLRLVFAHTPARRRRVTEEEFSPTSAGARTAAATAEDSDESDDSEEEEEEDDDEERSALWDDAL